MNTLEHTEPCPRCRSTETRHTDGDRWHCGNCGRTLRLVHTGKFVPFVDWLTAGHTTSKVKR